MSAAGVALLPVAAAKGLARLSVETVSLSPEAEAGAVLRLMVSHAELPVRLVPTAAGAHAIIAAAFAVKGARRRGAP